jgi:DNA-binding transcriptional LysR family regulator
MPKIAHRPAAKMERLNHLQELRRLSWDDLRVFLSCAERASFRKAAGQLSVSSSTVVRRIERLELALGTRLFDRLPEGVELTSQGRCILQSAQQMERAIFDVMRSTEEASTQRSSVTVSITEGLGSYWMMPQLVAFQQQHPMLLVNMCCAMESADVLRLQADMAIQFEKPTNPELIVVKLGRLHIYPFASRSYLDIYGTPSSPADMSRHRLVNQVAPQLDSGAWARELGWESIEPIVGLSTNASTALLYAIENGAGIGALPTYVAVLNERIVPVDIGARHQMDIWLTYHPDLRKHAHKAFLVDWVRKIFDPKNHPWFRDEFIHPRDLVGMATPRSPA